MSGSDVTQDGVRDARPGREALTGVSTGRRRRRGRRGEQSMVPEAEFTSYYGKPVINAPVWSVPDVPGYLFLGGLAGVSSLVAACSDVTGRPGLATVAKTGAAASGALSLVALVHDLGRPARFLNMLRMVKVTSPMNIGSWLLAAYVPAAGGAAASALTGKLPRLGALATAGAALLGPGVAAYTAALISDTAVPAWHDGYREMPFVFVGSAATAAGGLGLLAAPQAETAPARNLAVLGVAAELAAFQRMRASMGMVEESYDTGKAKRYRRAGEILSVAGAVGAVLGRRNRIVNALSGAALLAASAATRWAVFHAGMVSANDPKYTVVPQRRRVNGAGAGSRVASGVSGEEARAMDAITLLAQDHQRVLAILEQLEAGPTAAGGADEGQLQARKDLVTELVVAESRHETVEEQYFWPMVRNRLPDGEELAEQAVGQEAAAKHLLHDVDKAAPDQSDFEQLVTTIIADGRQHIEFEQTQVWPKVQAVVSGTELTELGQKMAKAKQLAPTRPHPATPSDAVAQKTAGPMAAMADKIRDAVTGRGRH